MLGHSPISGNNVNLQLCYEAVT